MQYSMREAGEMSGDKIVCKICILRKGLKASEVFSGDCSYAFDTSEQFLKHLHKDHGFKIVKKKGDRICMICGKE